MYQKWFEFYFNSETRSDSSDIFPAKRIQCETAAAGSVKHDSTYSIFKNFPRTYFFELHLPHTLPDRLYIYILAEHKLISQKFSGNVVTF